MKLLIYADLDLGLIDGSSTWLASLAEVLDSLGHEAHILSKVRFAQSKVLERIRACQPNLQVHMPDDNDAGMAPAQAARRAAELHDAHDFDALFVRGFAACAAFAATPPLESRLWSYITDLPFPHHTAIPSQLDRLQEVVSKSHRMLAQTESARSYLEAIAPAAAGKTLLLPPMIPDEVFAVEGERPAEPLRLVYAGKLARAWHTLEMLDLPRALDALGVNAELVVIGDKVQFDSDDPSWSDRMLSSLEGLHADSASGITWLGGLSRDEVFTEISKAHIGIGWRSRSLDGSLEVSTKALEYAAAGTAPLVNVSRDHYELWGVDYPLLVAGDDTVEVIARVIAEASDSLQTTAERAHLAARPFSFEAASERLAKHLSRGTQTHRSTVSPTNVLISSHDFKFLGELTDGLRRRDDVDLSFDRWTGLHTHDEADSLSKVERADVVFCEWAGPSLVWHAQHKRPGARLVTRLHGFELRGHWLASLDTEKVDQWVFVSDHHRDAAIKKLGLSPDRTTVIPNMIDTADLARPKLQGSEFHIALVGLVGFGKRPDRALTVLERLLEHDDRYRLHFKGRAPWDYPHEWKNPLQRQFYLDFYTRIRRSADLSDHVVFEPFTPDIASWLRGIGFVLSPSVAESFHLAPAEGMASGAIPVVWDRPGARDVFGDEWLVKDAEDAAALILQSRGSGNPIDAQRLAIEQAMHWDFLSVMPQWWRALGIEESARNIATGERSHNE